MSTSMPWRPPSTRTVMRSAATLDGGAHRLEHVDEGEVALAGGRPEPLDRDLPAGDGGGGEEVGRRRGVGLDAVLRRPVACGSTTQVRSSGRPDVGRRRQP